MNDLKGYKKWAKPFDVFGVNALALYIGSWIMASLLDVIQVGPGDKAVGLKDWFFNNCLLPIADPINASLIFALLFVGMWILFWKKIYIKV